jgi:cytochrome c oxidase subunit 3
MSTAPSAPASDPQPDDALAAFRPPAGTAVFGMSVAIASLSMAFGAAIIGYLVIRSRTDLVLALPNWFWLSTFIILISSVMLHWALLSARNNRPRTSRVALMLTALLALLFLLTQTPGLWQLLDAHRALAEQHLFLYRLVLFLVVLHGVHVLGGLIPLLLMAAKSITKPYDAEHAASLTLMSMYWHFLAIVWVVMFNVFLITA